MCKTDCKTVTKIVHINYKIITFLYHNYKNKDYYQTPKPTVGLILTSLLCDKSLGSHEAVNDDVGAREGNDKPLLQAKVLHVIKQEKKMVDLYHQAGLKFLQV